MSLVLKKLNLLLAFDVLMRERHVSRAAALLNISQSAMSKKLEHLRDLLKDPILVRTSNGMEATLRAKELYPKVQQILQLSEDVLTPSQTFSPKNFNKKIKVGMPNAIGDFLLPQIISPLKKMAPNLELHITDISSATLESRIMKNDIQIAITYALNLPQNLKSTLLFSDTPVCVAKSDHELMHNERISVQQYLSHEHVVLVYDEMNKHAGDELLIRKGYSPRKIALTATNALMILPIIAETNLVFSINSRFAEKFAPIFNLDYRPLPRFVPEIKINMIWSSLLHNSEWHIWLRQAIKKASIRE